jgi:hypothetical protein
MSFLDRPRSGAKIRFRREKEELFAGLRGTIDEALHMTLHPGKDPLATNRRVEALALIDQERHRRDTTEFTLDPDGLEKGSHGREVAPCLAICFVEKKGGRRGKPTDCVSDATKLGLDLRKGWGRELSLSIRHFGKAGVFDEEGTGSDEGGDLGVSMLGKKSEEVSIDRFGPGFLTRGESSADEGVIHRGVDRGGVERGSSAFSIPGHSDRGGSLIAEPICSGKGSLDLVAERVTSHLEGLAVDPLPMRLLGSSESMVFRFTRIDFSIEWCGDEDTESGRGKSQSGLLARGKFGGQSDDVFRGVGGVGKIDHSRSVPGQTADRLRFDIESLGGESRKDFPADRVNRESRAFRDRDSLQFSFKGKRRFAYDFDSRSEALVDHSEFLAEGFSRSLIGILSLLLGSEETGRSRLGFFDQTLHQFVGACHDPGREIGLVGIQRECPGERLGVGENGKAEEQEGKP